MSKLHHRKFARFFPSYHPRAGEPTDFVAKIWESIYLQNPEWLGSNYEQMKQLYPNIGLHGIHEPKHHTIRAGHHVKVGDFIRPSVWSGKPYKSKQIIIGPDIEVVKTWDFEFLHGSPISDHDVMAIVNGSVTSIMDIAKNDGLTEDEFIHWFNKPFAGQIICWNKDVNY